MFPQASGYPADLRATRALLRRRMSLPRKRAELLAHIQHTNSQYPLPERGQKLADQATRGGVAARFTAPAVHKSVAVDLTLRGYYAPRRSALAWHLIKAAPQHNPNTLYLLQTVPGSGEILRLVLLYEIHDIQRFPSVQDVVSDCRLVKCAKESAGKRYGTAGTTIGNAYLKWAFSAAAVLFLRDHPAGQQDRTRLEKTHGQGNAWTLLAQKLGRAVYDMVKCQKAFDMDKFLQAEQAERGCRTPHGP